MKLYRVEGRRNSDVTVTDWTTELAIGKKKYADMKDTWHDDEQAYEDDSITLVVIDVPEEVYEEFEDDSIILQKHVLCIDTDDEDEEGYVSSFWSNKNIEKEAGK